MEDWKALRGIAGMSQIQLAAAAGVSRFRLSLAECGQGELTEAERGSLRRTLASAMTKRAASIRSAMTSSVMAGARG